MKLEPPERANKMLNKANQEISAKKRAAVEARDHGAIDGHWWVGESHGMRSFQAAGFQPVRPEISTNSNLEATDVEDTEDEDNADDLGESGGMRARPQPRKP